MRIIDADILVQDTIQEYARSKQYRDAIIRMVNNAPTIEPKAKVVAQITFDEEKLREVVKEAVERFKEEYEITDRPQGKWIDEHEDGHGSWVGTCNQCGRGNHVDNFCPNCGADMREREGE